MQDQRHEAVPQGAWHPRPAPGRVDRPRPPRRWGKVRALLLDAYGTLFHYEREKLVGVFEEIVREQGLGVDAKTLLDRWQVYEGEFRRKRVYRENGQWRAADPFVSYKEAWAACFRSAFKDLNLTGAPDQDAVRILLRDIHKREAYPEVRQALEALRSRVPIVLLSNADEEFLYATLEHNGVSFDEVVFSEREKVYKPHPRIFQAALERVGAKAEEVVFSGDSPTEDIAGAMALGIPAVWINRSGVEWPLKDHPHPVYEVRDLLGLVDIVSSRTGNFY
jgi:2-haloalkanoic acid dehalogenase type II